ncbi:MAG: hypothetical protein RMJ55_14235, partial [Roseiflexaceae bacterium]|nr:hypothetical protein [Roseiflexaceae bacterium]
MPEAENPNINYAFCEQEIWNMLQGKYHSNYNPSETRQPGGFVCKKPYLLATINTRPSLSGSSNGVFKS